MKKSFALKNLFCSLSTGMGRIFYLKTINLIFLEWLNKSFRKTS